MRKALMGLLALLSAMLLSVAGWAQPSSAITGGEYDGDRHPNVGIAVMFGNYVPTGETNTYLGHCTGTLISPTIFLTAAHCLSPTDWGPDYELQRFVVSFHPKFEQNEDGVYLLRDPISGTPHFDPRYEENRDPDSRHEPGDGYLSYAMADYDLGVLVLQRPASDLYPGITPAPLPALGALEQFRAGTRNRYFTHVGYGLQREYEPPVAGGDFMDYTRNFAVSPLHKLTELRLETKGNPMDARGTGGFCSGDSGGPMFLGSTVVGVHSYGGRNGNTTCPQGSNDGSVRLDTASARSFLGQFVTLP